VDFVVSNAGELWFLRRQLALASADPADPVLHVFSNNYTPNRDTVLADLVESAWPGYAPVTLLPATWTEPETVAGAAVSWYGSGVVTIPATTGLASAWGGFVTDLAGALLLWSWRFDAVQSVASGTPCVLNVAMGTRSASEPVAP
jgi:hypothetical protein